MNCKNTASNDKVSADIFYGKYNPAESHLAVRNNPNIIHMVVAAKNLEPEYAEVLNGLLTALASFKGHRE